MQIYTYNKLLGRMREKGITQSELAVKIGISPCSMNLKINSKRDFKQGEIRAICDVLDIDTRLIDSYFFEH